MNKSANLDKHTLSLFTIYYYRSTTLYLFLELAYYNPYSSQQFDRNRRSDPNTSSQKHLKNFFLLFLINFLNQMLSNRKSSVVHIDGVMS